MKAQSTRLLAGGLCGLERRGVEARAWNDVFQRLGIGKGKLIFLDIFIERNHCFFLFFQLTVDFCILDRLELRLFENLS